ncbi:hypothetical protein ACFW15_29300, partial [Streptomyces sp. NPDC058953]
ARAGRRGGRGAAGPVAAAPRGRPAGVRRPDPRRIPEANGADDANDANGVNNADGADGSPPDGGSGTGPWEASIGVVALNAAVRPGGDGLVRLSLAVGRVPVPADG